MFRYKIVLSLLKFQKLLEQMLHQPQQKTYLLAVRITSAEDYDLIGELV